MAFSKKIITAITTLSVFAFVGSSATAASYRHIDTLALRIARNSNELVNEFRSHYRHTSSYRHLLTDARELAAHANHIHEVAYHRGSLTHLANDLRDMDRFYNHLETLLDRVESSVRRRGYGAGHIHGHTGHVWELMHSIEDDLHYLRADVDAMRSYRTNRTVTRRITVPAPAAFPSRGLRVPPVPVPPRATRVYRAAPRPCPGDFNSRNVAIPTPFGFLTIGR